MNLRPPARPAAWLLACTLLGIGFPPGSRVLCVSADRHVTVESGAESCVAACALAGEPTAGEGLNSAAADGCGPCTDIPLGTDAAQLARAKHLRPDAAHGGAVGAAAAFPRLALHAQSAGPRLEVGFLADPAPPPLRSVRLRL